MLACLAVGGGGVCAVTATANAAAAIVAAIDLMFFIVRPSKGSMCKDACLGGSSPNLGPMVYAHARKISHNWFVIFGRKSRNCPCNGVRKPPQESWKRRAKSKAAHRGFEPRLKEPETFVLPLDEWAMLPLEYLLQKGWTIPLPSDCLRRQLRIRWLFGLTIFPPNGEPFAGWSFKLLEKHNRHSDTNRDQ